MKKFILNAAKAMLPVITMILFACCEDPYVDITYNLHLPMTLLEKATVKATYIGNNGETVTFDIPDSEWKDSESTANYMKWTKHVHYRDFSVVEDNIDITLIPKEGKAADPISVEIITSYWNCQLDIRDDDGDIHHIFPTNIDNNITIALSRTKTWSEVIEGIHLHRGFHVESNGSYRDI